MSLEKESQKTVLDYIQERVSKRFEKVGFKPGRIWLSSNPNEPNNWVNIYYENKQSDFERPSVQIKGSISESSS